MTKGWAFRPIVEVFDPTNADKYSVPSTHGQKAIAGW
jgi:hypothetical protein